MAHTIAEALAVTVDSERRSRDISIRSLADQTGIPLPTLARRLNPNAASPFTANEIERIASVFDVRASDLFLAAEVSAA